MTQATVVISGASGLIGSALAASLRHDGTRVVRLVRRQPRHADEVEWLTGAAPDPEVLSGAAAVVNLNGASIGRLPWTREYRRTLLRSRLEPTAALADMILALGSDAPPLLSASAVGFYGSRPGVKLKETSAAGDTFLSDVCARWEAEALRAAAKTRVALLRTAPLLHPNAVLRPMILLTRFGLGGPLGSGKQIWPWISLEDEVRAIRHLISSDVCGPVNLAGPEPSTADGIGRALAARLGRPYLLPAPAWALRLGLGRAAADSLLLADADVEPRVLNDSGFVFRHPTAASAISAAIG